MTPQDLSQLLERVRAGDAEAVRQLFVVVNEELRQKAQFYLQRERAGHTLQATALVNEAFVKIIGGEAVGSWEGKTHFFNAAARAMRRILVDHARARKRDKRGGDAGRSPLDSQIAAPMDREDSGFDIEKLDAALEKLSSVNERAAQVVEHRFFGGRSEREVAAILKVSVRTVADDWAFARAWLRREMDSMD